MISSLEMFLLLILKGVLGSCEKEGRAELWGVIKVHWDSSLEILVCWTFELNSLHSSPIPILEPETTKK